MGSRRDDCHLSPRVSGRNTDGPRGGKDYFTRIFSGVTSLTLVVVWGYGGSPGVGPLRENEGS